MFKLLLENSEAASAYPRGGGVLSLLDLDLEFSGSSLRLNTCLGLPARPGPVPGRGRWHSAACLGPAGFSD